jgi:hypothetical protein
MTTWDDRIDEAARRLTEGRPRTGFATRVVARLEDRPLRWSPAWLLAPAAAALVILITVVAREQTSEVARRAMPSTSTDIALAPDAGNARFDPDTATTDVRVEPAVVQRAGGGPIGVVVMADSVAAAVDLETDLAVAPLELPPVTASAALVEALEEPPALAVEPLGIAALEMLETALAATKE